MTCMLGYATASAVEQNLDGQLAALNAEGVDPRRVFTDKLSESADRARGGLYAMLSYARSGDTVIVVALDRLGRTTAEVTRTIADLTDRGLRLRACGKASTPARRPAASRRHPAQPGRTRPAARPPGANPSRPSRPPSSASCTTGPSPASRDRRRRPPTGASRPCRSHPPPRASPSGVTPYCLPSSARKIFAFCSPKPGNALSRRSTSAPSGSPPTSTARRRHRRSRRR